MGGWTLLISARRRGISGLTSVGRPHDCLHVSDRRPSNRPDSTAGLLRVWCRHSPQRAERSGDRCRALTRLKQLCKPSPTACIGRFLLKQLQALSNGLYRTIPTYTLTATVSSSHLSAHTSLHAAGRPRERTLSGRGAWTERAVAAVYVVTGRDLFDLPRHSHYSGVIPMVFEHSA